MFGNWPDWLHLYAALLCIGAVIKLLDDALDVQFDFARGRRTLAGRMGRSVAAYVAVLALLAAVIDPAVSVAVFFGGYAVGMFTSLRERMPTRLPAWLETVIALAISTLVCGWQNALWGLSMMAVVDWIDDLRDVRADEVTGQRNMVKLIGLAETLLLVLVALCISVLTHVDWTLFTFLALPVLEVSFELTTKRLWKTDEDQEVDVN